MDKCFDALNVNNFSHGAKSLKPFQMPYTSVDDFRLKVWIENDFLGYLKDWKFSVENRTEFTSVAWAAAVADTPASNKVTGLSGEVMLTSNAAVLPKNQLGTNGTQVYPNSTHFGSLAACLWDSAATAAIPAVEQDSTRTAGDICRMCVAMIRCKTIVHLNNDSHVGLTKKVIHHILQQVMSSHYIASISACNGMMPKGVQGRQDTVNHQMCSTLTTRPEAHWVQDADPRQGMEP
eukprot:Em0006g520a